MTAAAPDRAAENAATGILAHGRPDRGFVVYRIHAPVASRTRTFFGSQCQNRRSTRYPHNQLYRDSKVRPRSIKAPENHVS